MQSINFRTARGNLSEVLNNVEAGEEVEITRRGREPAVIVSKATFEAYKKAALDAEFASLFDTLADNIKEDRTPEDLLLQVMLDLGVPLSSEITETLIAGKKVFNVADGFLMACFDENVTEETITAIAKMQPYYFVMRDSSMANDSVATNFDQLFNTYSPSTVRKVL